DEIRKVEDVLEDESVENKEIEDEHKLLILIDRIVTNQEEETISRMADSVQTAFFEGKGDCYVEFDGNKKHFSDRFELDGLKFEVPSPNCFSFNNPYGACPKCEGFGRVLEIDEDLVIP